MALVQSIIPRAGLIPISIHYRYDMSQIKIVQYDDARYVVQQAKHMLMESGVAKMIDHTLVLGGVRFEPFHTSLRKVGLDPGIRDRVLSHDHVNIIVA